MYTINNKYLKIHTDVSQYICTPLVLIDLVYINDKIMGGHYNNTDINDIEIYSDDSDRGFLDEIYSDEGYFEE